MARPAPKPRKYEMMIVVAPTVTEDGLPAVVERVTGLIEAQEGVVESFTHDNPWGHRRLAYPIQNFRDAFYVLYYFDMAPRGVQELDRELRLDAAVIRHLIVKFDPLTVRTHDADGDEDEEDDDFDTAEVTTAPARPAQAAASSDADDDEDEAEDEEAGDDADADDDADDDETEEPEASADEDESDEESSDEDETDDGEEDEE